MQEVLRMRGSIRIALLDPDGKVLQERMINNTLVLGGRSWVLGQLQTVNQVTSQVVSHFAIGSGTVAPNVTNTALGNELTRVAMQSFVTTALTANPPSMDCVATYATNIGNGTLGEAGLFNSSAGGTMLNRATFATFAKTTSNTLSATFTISG